MHMSWHQGRVRDKVDRTLLMDMFYLDLMNIYPYMVQDKISLSNEQPTGRRNGANKI